MSATARAPLVRAGPGVAVWTALPERDRALLLWLVQGDVVTAELAALLAYGHRRIAQRRLARLREYGLLTGFWAANRQRPRGRYAYALTKLARAQLERLVWPGGKPALGDGAIETVSPVIHQLATHDLFATFLRAVDRTRAVGVCGWVPERACLRLAGGFVRPDALAVLPVGDRSIVLVIERDLGTERGGTLPEKVRRYRSLFARSQPIGPLHVGIVVDSARRLLSVRRILARVDQPTGPIRVWLTTEPALAADAHAAVWSSPEGTERRTVDLEAHWVGDPWPLLGEGCLAEGDGLEVLDERVMGLVPGLAWLIR